jgi:DNA-binding PadR family transcriptional regulator
MSSRRLSTTSYVVLGVIALRGPSTPYDLKRAIGRSIGYFWTFPHAQLYSEPKRLHHAGLLDLQQEPAGRRRKTYTLTEEGRSALTAWLAEPPGAHFEMRDIAEIKLFFNELAQPEDITRLAKDQITQHERRLAEYNHMRERYGDVSDLATRLVTLDLGLRMEHAALEFWREIHERAESTTLSEISTIPRHRQIRR